MSTVIPRSSVKSVHPSPSAEDDGLTDLPLPLGMTQSIIPKSFFSFNSIRRHRSVHPSPSPGADGWTDWTLLLGMTVDIIPHSVHHSSIILIVQYHSKNKSVHPSSSAEDDGWTDFLL